MIVYLLCNKVTAGFQPLMGCHTSDSLENTEERSFSAEKSLDVVNPQRVKYSVNIQ